MRQIYLLASDADAQAAGEISDLLAQRGYQVRRADEALAFPPARPHEITLALWSRNVELSAKQILFTNRAAEGPAALWTVENTGKNPTLLYAGPNTIVSVDWSPDGSTIAFAMAQPSRPLD